MAHAAVKGSDRVWFTSDNPRSEDPEQILHDMGRGIDASNTQRVRSEVDRAEAIAAALTSAEPDDVVLIAGKGHEQTQEINGELFLSATLQSFMISKVRTPDVAMVNRLSF